MALSFVIFKRSLRDEVLEIESRERLSLTTSVLQGAIYQFKWTIIFFNQMFTAIWHIKVESSTNFNNIKIDD